MSQATHVDKSAHYLPSHPLPSGKFMAMLASFWMVGSLYSASAGWLVIPWLGWRAFVLVASLPAFACCALMAALVPESPRYLSVMGRGREAAQVGGGGEGARGEGGGRSGGRGRGAWGGRRRRWERAGKGAPRPGEGGREQGRGQGQGGGAVGGRGGRVPVPGVPEGDEGGGGGERGRSDEPLRG